MNAVNKQRILMIAATPFFSDRGCHIRIYNEIYYLQKEGIRVTLCTYHLGTDIKGFDIKRIRDVKWYTKITPGAAWGKLYLDWLLLRVVWREYRTYRPRIIHAHLYEGLMIAAVLKLFFRKQLKIIFDCQGSLAEEMYAYTLHKSPLLKPFYWLFKGIEKLLLSIPDYTVCSSQNSYNVLINNYHIPKEKIGRLDDGVDEDIFTSIEYSPKQITEELGIPEDRLIIIYTGSLSRAKGVDRFMDALPTLLKKRKDIAIVFAGYGELEEEYTQKLQSYIDSKQVFFVGRFSYFDLPRYTSIADYAIEPKQNSSESSGKLYNYIVAGLPVICFKNDFHWSVLQDRGVYIQSFDDLASIQFPMPNTPMDLSSISWNTIIKKLHHIYE